MNGICFIEPLFHATIEERKTQTRRIMKPQPTGDYHGRIEFTKRNRTFQKFDFTCGLSVTPRYQVGEILYLKEPYACKYPYKFSCLYKYANDCLAYTGLKWQNKQSMPEKYARYFIEITGVRCERLQEISDEDCLKEGICKVDNLSTYKSFALPETPNYAEFYTMQQAYAALINKIGGKGTWESNLYVWVYELKLKTI